MAARQDRCNLLCFDLPKAEALRQARPNVVTATDAAGAARPSPIPHGWSSLGLRDGGELCVCDLAWVTERSDKLVSHHVRQLRVAGLVRSRRDGKMVMYELTELGSRAVGRRPARLARRGDRVSADGDSRCRSCRRRPRERPAVTPTGTGRRAGRWFCPGSAWPTWPSRAASGSGRASPPARWRLRHGALRRSSRASRRSWSSGASPAPAACPTPPSTAPLAWSRSSSSCSRRSSRSRASGRWSMAATPT